MGYFIRPETTSQYVSIEDIFSMKFLIWSQFCKKRNEANRNLVILSCIWQTSSLLIAPEVIHKSVGREDISSKFLYFCDCWIMAYNHKFWHLICLPRKIYLREKLKYVRNQSNYNLYIFSQRRRNLAPTWQTLNWHSLKPTPKLFVHKKII